MKILITGAAGNLGGLLARHIRDGHPDLRLILMQHRTRVPADLARSPDVAVRTADLSKPETLPSCIVEADVIVHFAGVLFKAGPEKFLPETNTQYFKNLVDAATSEGVKKIILISFPHVEGPSTRQAPATGHVDGRPISVHAQTRLEEERLLFREIPQPVSLRVGMVYGKGILMVDAARWLARRRLLGVWKTPTQIHLISKTDFCRAVVAAILKSDASGIYHIGDAGDDTLQSFLDFACALWGYPSPHRMPLWLIYLAARTVETVSGIVGTKSPLTKDFIDIGRVPYYGDTGRFRSELLTDLKYPTVQNGIADMIR